MSTSPEGTLPPDGARQYEFTPEQDRLIVDLAAKMRFVGFFALFMGALGLGLMVYIWMRGVLYVDVGILVMLFLGFWTLGAARSFQEVADTKGRDISHVMKALGELRSMFSLLYWVLLVGIVLVAVLFFLAPKAG
jgi:hypothetical protein